MARYYRGIYNGRRVSMVNPKVITNDYHSITEDRIGVIVDVGVNFVVTYGLDEVEGGYQKTARIIPFFASDTELRKTLGKHIHELTFLNMYAHRVVEVEDLQELMNYQDAYTNARSVVDRKYGNLSKYYYMHLLRMSESRKADLEDLYTRYRHEVRNLGQSKYVWEGV